MYALGVILFAMCTRQMPFGFVQVGQSAMDDPRYRVFCSNKETFWNHFAYAGLSNELKSLLDAMLHPDPAQRPTGANIYEHPWMK